MMSFRRITRIFLIAVLLLNVSGIKIAHAAGTATPEITAINRTGDKLNDIIVSGETVKNSEVLIYIDGSYFATAINSPAINNFEFFSLIIRSDELTAGRHTVMAIARDLTSLVLSAPTDQYDLYAISSHPDAPTLIAPNAATVTGKVKPLITGLTVSGTKVRIFIDGIFDGQTEILTDSSGTANFAYTPFLNLTVGAHTVSAIAEDTDGSQSSLSRSLNFRIEAPLPAPVIFKPIVNSASSYQPLISGLSVNDVQINVFIDKKLDSSFKVTNSPSGTANFTYLPSKPLTNGQHLVYTTAIDERGKESLWSNIIYFNVGTAGSSTGPVITPEAATSEAEYSSRLKDLLVLARLFETNQNTKLSVSEAAALSSLLNRKSELDLSDEELGLLERLQQAETSSEPAVEEKDEDQINAELPSDAPTEVNNEAAVEEERDDQSSENGISDSIDEFLNVENATSAETGMINESKEQQSKLRLNLIIFILFLIAVIAWIFWVNRELIKERREQNAGQDGIGKKDEDSSKSDDDSLSKL